MRFNMRQQQILDILMARESATMSELSDLLQVSTVTVRADLNALAEHGDVIRTHGSAHILQGRTRQELSFATRQEHNAVQKAYIGQVAADLVSPVKSILLDASSTAVAVAKGIKFHSKLRDLTVVTTGIWTALELMGVQHIHVVLAGGYAREQTGSLTGSITQKVLQSSISPRPFSAPGVSRWTVD
jgi:DeoR/GlpR family transcriptional regulator of sugar metabolism